MVLLSTTANAMMRSQILADQEELPPDEVEKKWSSYFNAAVLLTIVEFIVFFYAVYLAWQCNDDDKVIHLLAAIMFPIPYVLYSKLWKKCSRGGGKWLK